MKGVILGVVIGAGVILRVYLFIARRRRRAARAASGAEPAPVASTSVQAPRRRGNALEAALGDVGLIAGREIRERIRGRIFRVGTLVILVGVAAAIVIPALRTTNAESVQKVGVVGPLSPGARGLIVAAGRSNQDKVEFFAEPSVKAAKVDLAAGRVDFTIVDARQILLTLPASSSQSPADSQLVTDVAEYLGVLRTYEQAGLTPSQIAKAIDAKPLPVRTLEPSPKSSKPGTSIIGIVLLFFMLTQYCTWILIGVMQEKSSRVVEVLLAVVRPIQLLGGKVLGIGAVALGQAALIVGFALALGAAVGSDLLHGTAPVALVSELVWLVLGYAFYCWVYAAAGSTAERQDQVQTLALPLSLPILFGYIYSVSVLSSGTPDLFFKVLAYLPPTAPFCMSALVGLGQVHWWEFVISALISIAGTAATALFAARIYGRAVLRTGSRVRIRELLGGQRRLA
jgi:ABC-2 type transport system permease protein